MPHLRLRGISAAHVQTLSRGLAEELAPILTASLDSFTFEALSTQFFADGETNSGWPFVEILMFERAADQKAKCAQVLTDRLKALTQAEYVTVVFLPIPKTDYFENGQHF